MNHLASEIVVGASADPAEPRLASGRVLTRHKTNPRRKFPSRNDDAIIINAMAVKRAFPEIDSK
jgi:hypothetical protein